MDVNGQKIPDKRQGKTVDISLLLFYDTNVFTL